MKSVLSLAALILCYSGAVLAADAPASVPASGPDKKPVAHHKHKKDCIEHQGKPCHLHAASNAADKPATDAAQPAAMVSSTLQATATVLPVEIKPATKPAAMPMAEGVALARSSGCLNCHSLSGTTGGVYGPNWNRVAMRYRNDDQAEARLVNKIAHGGSGVWGSNAMPANAPRVSEQNIQALARFVLSLPDAPH